MSGSRTELVHGTAARGFQRSADDYVLGRPGYADPAIDLVVRSLDRTRLPVVDVGAGAGAMSEVLRRKGVTPISLEPVYAMLEKVSSSIHRVNATAQSLPLSSASVAGVVCAQAFHWFATREVVDEFHRVIAGDGPLALVWNERDATVDWVAKFDEIVDRHAGATPEFSDLSWRQALGMDSGFGGESYREFPNLVPSNRDAVVARALSTSFIALLADGERNQVADEVRALADGLPDGFHFPYRTRVWMYRRIDG